MPSIPEMDEFVNWENTSSPSAGAGAELFQTGSANATPNHDLDLALENDDGDNFSFWALQHFENTNPNPAALDPTVDPALTTNSHGAHPQAFEESFEISQAPCAHCQLGGYHCKKINEGDYKGYCTSCVALRCACSFGLASQGPPTKTTFPANPWPTLGDHPHAIPQENIQPELLHSTSAPDLPSMIPPSAETPESRATPSAPKVGARFSRESVRILKNWLSTHNRHPYPTEEEKEMLQKQTGLNKTQITNWLANARRRGKVVAPRSTSPGVRSWSNPIDIPPRRGTPATFEHMNPLQRWQHSPPEHEPASVTAIARAVTASSSTLSSGLNSPFSRDLTDDGSGKSLCAASSASSANTSNSSTGSFASAYSHASRGSLGSYGSLNRGRRRRRRKTAPRRPEAKSSLSAPLKTYQCTFCTETFRTKHDWQRHEKSLHLSLERWVCAPDGPRALNPDNNLLSCVFCGEASPDDVHIENHNHSACQERTLDERTFYRKDHLRQHLKLVHGTAFLPWSMEPWKVATPQIRSRCGFCGIIMDTWTIRVDHLAEHFKTGDTMADWKGDWGFEAPVLEMVENSIPPYLIHDERNSPLPYHANQLPSGSPRSAYELLKSELAYFKRDFKDDTGRPPTDEELQLEACRIIFGAEVLSSKGISSTPSWLRDLLLSSEEIATRAQLAPIRSHSDSRMAKLKIIGKDNIFEEDPLEANLSEFVKSRQLLGLTAMDRELQVEACNILGRVEETSTNPCDEVANFLLRLILASTRWLSAFRQRVQLPRSEDVEDENLRSKDPNTIDSTIHNYSRLEAELAEYVKKKRALGIQPDDMDLQRQARIIIYEFDDGWNQTAADNMDWLRSFKQRHLQYQQQVTSSAVPDNNLTPTHDPGATMPPIGMNAPGVAASSGIPALPTSDGANGDEEGAEFRQSKVLSLFLNDANCYRRLARELGRYVASTTSPNNPNRHVPTDEELQHQARWILYDDDDPWNQTAADNAEWLRRFKRDVGIITDSSVPGLPDDTQWSVSQGGSGFAPPYAYPNPRTQGCPFQQNDKLSIPLQEGSKPFEAESATANKYYQSLTSRLPPPASVFCSRELENGLAEFVTAEVASASLGLTNQPFPTDDDLRAKARDILGIQSTSADDAVLLNKFKNLMKTRLGLSETDGHPESQPPVVGPYNSLVSSPMAGVTTASEQAQESSALPLDMNLTMTDGELTDILQGMDLDFGPDQHGGWAAPQ